MDGKDSFMIFRRFGYLQTRLLLEKEGRLTQLEKELDDMDWDDFEENPDQLRTMDLNSKPRRDLLAEAERYFREYAELMTAVQRLRCFEKPTKLDYKAVRRFHYHYKPLTDFDMEPIRTREDLVALRPAKEPDWLEDRIGRFIVATQSRWFMGLFQTRQTHRAKTYDITLVGASPLPSPIILSIVTNHQPVPNVTTIDVNGSRITNLATAIVAFLTAVLLVLPVLICYILVTNVGGSKGYFGCIAILFLFTLIFACSMAFYSKAKRHEVLAATAAYCAVIVVFLGNAAPS
ncbi:hypothetical protein SLS60_008348 [Paraconiothyrium brasiliense]|uniref:DUF6594 domain-containing protein n=1 Tax=Paraconiothyrium brasiliense TaxID=300254 RepID=A0ABR3R0B6_9PLEO